MNTAKKIVLSLGLLVSIPVGIAHAGTSAPQTQTGTGTGTGTLPTAPQQCHIYVCVAPPWGTMKDCVMRAIPVPCWLFPN